MRRCEYKKRYNPRSGKHEYHHIHSGEILGGGVLDPFRWVASKLSGKAAKKMVGDATKKAAEKAAERAALSALTKTGDYAGRKAGDKIAKLMFQQNKKTLRQPQGYIGPTQEDPDLHVQRILSGGKMRRSQKVDQSIQRLLGVGKM